MISQYLFLFCCLKNSSSKFKAFHRMRPNFLTPFNSSENWEENTVDDDDFFDFDDEFIDDVFYDEEETFPSYSSYDSSPPYSYFDEYDEFNDQGSNIPYLEKYGTDLTLLAAEGKLNECFGRDAELLAVMEILVRRQKNNPVLIGDAGVGKTAIVELFATRLVRNLVPFILQGRRIVSLDLSRIIAGSRYRGEFELRFRRILDEVLEEPQIIVFIDEIHNINGAGSAEGSLDAANILKPVLSRSGFQCIGATTTKEYERLEKDPALNRRFQSIKVNEPTIDQTISILYYLRPMFESYHNVEITEGAIVSAVNLSQRYIYDRFLPDKAIDLIDRACAKEVIRMTSSEFDSILASLVNTSLVHIGGLKAEAFRKGDIALEFVLQEIENAYRNFLLRWIHEPESVPYLPVLPKSTELSPLGEELFDSMRISMLTNVQDLLFTSRTPGSDSPIYQRGRMFPIDELSAEQIANIFRNIQNHINADMKFDYSILSLPRYQIFLTGLYALFEDINDDNLKYLQEFEELEQEFQQEVTAKQGFSDLFIILPDSLNKVEEPEEILKVEPRESHLLNDKIEDLEKLNIIEELPDLEDLGNYRRAKEIYPNQLTFYNETIEKYGLEWSLFGKEWYPELLNDESLTLFESNQEWYEESNHEWYEESNQESNQEWDEESNQEWDEESNHEWYEESNQEWDEWNPSLGKWEEWNACLKTYDNLILYENHLPEDFLLKTNNNLLLNGVYSEKSELVSQSPLPLVNAYQESDTELIDLLEPEDQTNFEVINTNHVSLAGLPKWMSSYLMLKESLESEVQYFFYRRILQIRDLIKESSIGYIKELDFCEEDMEIDQKPAINHNFLSQLEVNRWAVFRRYLKELRPLVEETFLDSLFRTSESSLALSSEEKRHIYDLLGYFSTSKGHQEMIRFDDPDLIRRARSMGEMELLKARVTEEKLQGVLSVITGIPLDTLSVQESEKLLALETTLHQRVVGQERAISVISKAIRRARLGIQNPNRPLASFMFCGPTGVGKTEVTKALAEALFGSETNLIRFDMSEFMDKFTVSRLIGSPPGYIGYEEGGQLTDMVRNKPYSVVLFDEIEKAHPEILNLLLQILEDGRLTDTQKRLVKFTNTLVIMTSNAGSEDILNFVQTPEFKQCNEEIQKIEQRILDRKKTRLQKNEAREHGIKEEKTEEENSADVKKPAISPTRIAKRKGYLSDQPYPKKIPARYKHGISYHFLEQPIRADFLDNIRANVVKSLNGSLRGEIESDYEAFVKFLDSDDTFLENQEEKSQEEDTKAKLEKEEAEQERFIRKEEEERELNMKERNKLDAELKKVVISNLTTFFLPEFLNRLDDIIVFQPLTAEELVQICEIMIKTVAKRVLDKGIIVQVGPAVRRHLAYSSYDPAYGARPLRRSITRNIEDKIVDNLLEYPLSTTNRKLNFVLNSAKEVVVEWDSENSIEKKEANLKEKSSSEKIGVGSMSK